MPTVKEHRAWSIEQMRHVIKHPAGYLGTKLTHKHQWDTITKMIETHMSEILYWIDDDDQFNLHEFWGRYNQVIGRSWGRASCDMTSNAEKNTKTLNQYVDLFETWIKGGITR